MKGGGSKLIICDMKREKGKGKGERLDGKDTRLGEDG